MKKEIWIPTLKITVPVIESNRQLLEMNGFGEQLDQLKIEADDKNLEGTGESNDGNGNGVSTKRESRLSMGDKKRRSKFQSGDNSGESESASRQE